MWIRKKYSIGALSSLPTTCCFPFRSAGEIPCDLPASCRAWLPHILPAAVREETWTLRWVKKPQDRSVLFWCNVSPLKQFLHCMIWLQLFSTLRPLWFWVFSLFVEALLVNPDPKQYVWVCQGVTVVDNMDDGEELMLTDVSTASL